MCVAGGIATQANSLTVIVVARICAAYRDHYHHALPQYLKRGIPGWTRVKYCGKRKLGRMRQEEHQPLKRIAVVCIILVVKQFCGAADEHNLQQKWCPYTS